MSSSMWDKFLCMGLTLGGYLAFWNLDEIAAMVISLFS